MMRRRGVAATTSVRVEQVHLDDGRREDGHGREAEHEEIRPRIFVDDHEHDDDEEGDGRDDRESDHRAIRAYEAAVDDEAIFHTSLDQDDDDSNGADFDDADEKDVNDGDRKSVV